jgi:mRNA interferase RelE/StbE
MAGYKVYFRESVEKDFAGIPRTDLRKIIQRIAALTEDPRPPGCESLTGQERYRLRQGTYRIVYSLQDREDTVSVVKVGHLKDIYRH